MWHEWLVTVKEGFEQLWKWILAAWGISYGAFLYLFQPTKAWGAVWWMFLASFVTKMIQLMWDSEQERLRWVRLRENFSSRTAIYKAMPKIFSYLFLMFTTARANEAFPGTLSSNVHLAFSSFAFAVELINCLKHLSEMPGANVGQLIVWIKNNIAPKGIDLE